MAMAVYRRCVRMATGSGLDNVRLVHSLHAGMLKRLRPERVEVFGQTLHLDPDDSLNLSIHGTFEPATTDLLSSLISEGDTVLDIGAHIGYFTLLFAKLTGPSGMVYAFEAHPDNAALLQRSVAKNGHRHVVVENKAVSWQPGTLNLFECEEGTVDHRIVGRNNGRSHIEVDAVALDDYLAPDLKVDLIKMDIQGAEGLALTGMQSMVERQERLTLVSEFEPWGLDASDFGARKYLDMLKDLGFTLYDVDSPDGIETPVEPAALCESYPPIKDRFTNLYCVKGAPKRRDAAGARPSNRSEPV